MKMKKEDMKFISNDFWQNEANKLNTPEKLKKFIKGMDKLYHETDDTDVLLAMVKVVSKVKRVNISQIAKKRKIQRKSIYNMLNKQNVPAFDTFLNYVKDIGIKVIFH